MRQLIKSLLAHKILFSTVTFFVVSFLLFLPGQDLPKVEVSIPYLDKIAHAGMFSVLTFSFGFDYYSRKQIIPNAKQSFILFLFLVGYAILSEIIQDRFTHRTGDINDVYADTAGVLIGIFFLHVFGLRIYQRIQGYVNS